MFCFLLQQSYEIQVTNITSISENNEYVVPIEETAGTDGSKSTFSIKATVKKEVPQDAIVSRLSRND
jgi:hypothetical protein